MSERSRKYHHARVYKRTLERWKAANMAEGVCHELAAAEAREAYPLTVAEQAELDTWLDMKYPERRRGRPRGDYPSAFDELPSAG